MNLKYNALVVIFFSLITSVSSAQTKKPVNLIKTGAVLEKLAGGFSFTEGPAADSQGNVYFTDQPNDRIMIWTIGEQLITFMEPCGRSNGLYFDKTGCLWACADEKNELWKIDMDKNIVAVQGEFRGKPFNGPNDLWIDQKGRVYFTDPFYQRSWWKHTAIQQEKQCVYLFNPDSKSAVRVAEDLVKPNGIVGSHDGERLYIADIGGNKTWLYSINSDGTLTNKKLFCEKGSDGITLDTRGNLYLTGNGVTIFNKKGEEIANIPVPEKWTANVCFGGKDGKSLFITASTGLYRMRMLVKGDDR